MMKRYFTSPLLVVATSTAVAAAPGHAIQTGEGLLKMCTGAEKVKMLGMMCHSYLNGHLDTAMYLNKGGKFCLGPGDKERLPTVVVTWLNAHPDHLKKPAPEALGKLLPENYPCRK
jgi:hypothetical protein